MRVYVCVCVWMKWIVDVFMDVCVCMCLWVGVILTVACDCG